MCIKHGINESSVYCPFSFTRICLALRTSFSVEHKSIIYAIRDNLSCSRGIHQLTLCRLNETKVPMNVESVALFRNHIYSYPNKKNSLSFNVAHHSMKLHRIKKVTFEFKRFIFTWAARNREIYSDAMSA